MTVLLRSGCDLPIFNIENPWKKSDSAKPFLDFHYYEGLGKELSSDYRDNIPFPNIVIDNFLPQSMAEKVLKKFPNPDSDIWLDWQKRDVVNQPKKQGIGDATRLIGADRFLIDILSEFNSYTVVNFLELLTGIEHLIVDHTYLGGGLHQTLPGGKLNIHTDFTVHRSLGLYRRINLLLFLNENWKPEYGGALELWDENMVSRVHEIQPIFNRCVIFNTSTSSNHGQPTPVSCPADMTRKSIALYYYTSTPQPGDDEVKPTTWKEPGNHLDK